MNKINEAFRKVKDLEDVLNDYNSSKNKIKHLEREINTLSAVQVGEEKLSLEKRIQRIEDDLKKTEEEIKKINLFSKECHTLSDIKMLLEFVREREVVVEKVVSYFESLILTVYLDSEKCKGDRPLPKGIFKALKINLEIDDFLRITREREEIFLLCEDLLRKRLREELEGIIPPRLFCFVDTKYVYLLCLQEVSEEPSEDVFLGGVSPVGVDYLNNLVYSIDILNEIFRRNLSTLLLSCSLTQGEVEDTNSFLSQTELFITDVEEWKLDSAMKEVISLSRRERKWQSINWLEEEAFLKEGMYKEKVEGSSFSLFKVMKDTRCNSVIKENSVRDNKFIKDTTSYPSLPKEISLEFYRILLCIKVILSCNSKRLEKAEKFLERALLKMMSQEGDTVLLHQFLLFSDLTAFVRLFPSVSLPLLSNRREELFFSISRRSTELKKSLNDSLLLLKVYLKEKHFDFVCLVEKFVPPKSQLAFEISFFNLLYANVCDTILCIKHMDNEKIVDLSRLIRYALALSSRVPRGCIEQFKRLESFGRVFDTPLEEVEESSLEIPREEIEILFRLLR